MNKNKWDYRYWNTEDCNDNFRRDYLNDWFACAEDEWIDFKNGAKFRGAYLTKNTEYIPLVIQLKNKELARITESKNIIISGTQKEFDELEKEAAPELKWYALLFKQILKLQGRE